MAKKDKSVWTIFFQGLKIYALNIHKFTLYMAFPVLGQLLGLFLVFGLTYWYSQNYQNLVAQYPILNDMFVMLGCIILIVLPGLVVFVKAFWDYLVAFVALNSMTDGYLNTGKVYDFKAHNALVSQKTFSFIAIWLIISLFSLIGIIFGVFALVIFVYFILVFQIFTFENGHSPIGYIKRSFQLIKGKFGRTFLLMTILGVFTYYLLSAGLGVIFDCVKLTDILSKVFESWAYTLPIEALEPFKITPDIIGKELVKQLIFFIAIGFTLPIRSICWTLWYHNISDVVVEEKPKKAKKKTVSKKKTPEKSFKIEKRQIDPEIIRRARWEDDEY